MRSTQQLIPAIELITAINNLSRIAGKEKSIESIKVVKGRPDHLLVTVKSVSGDRTGDANRKQKSEVRIESLLSEILSEGIRPNFKSFTICMNASVNIRSALVHNAASVRCIESLSSLLFKALR